MIERNVSRARNSLNRSCTCRAESASIFGPPRFVPPTHRVFLYARPFLRGTSAEAAAALVRHGRNVKRCFSRVRRLHERSNGENGCINRRHFCSSYRACFPLRARRVDMRGPSSLRSLFGSPCNRLAFSPRASRTTERRPKPPSNLIYRLTHLSLPLYLPPEK